MPSKKRGSKKRRSRKKSKKRPQKKAEPNQDGAWNSNTHEHPLQQVSHLTPDGDMRMCDECFGHTPTIGHCAPCGYDLCARCYSKNGGPAYVEEGDDNKTAQTSDDIADAWLAAQTAGKDTTQESDTEKTGSEPPRGCGVRFLLSKNVQDPSGDDVVSIELCFTCDDRTHRLWKDASSKAGFSARSVEAPHWDAINVSELAATEEAALFLWNEAAAEVYNNDSVESREANTDNIVTEWPPQALRSDSNYITGCIGAEWVEVMLEYDWQVREWLDTVDSSEKTPALLTPSSLAECKAITINAVAAKSTASIAVKPIKQSAQEDRPWCVKCGSDQRPNKQSLLRCGRCKQVRYCGVKCQKAHWKVHKSLCKTMTAKALDK